MGVQAELTTLEASKPNNRHLNRYRDVYPYDHSRVCLQSSQETDYINASLVKVIGKQSNLPLNIKFAGNLGGYIIVRTVQ